MKILEIESTRDIPDIIHDMRLDAKLTQGELAIKCNVSKCAVVNYENGYQMPSIPVLIKMMRAMGIDEIRVYTKKG